MTNVNINGKTVTLRKATEDDREVLFHWANDSLVRSNAFRQETIEWSEHVVWFERVLGSESSFQYIVQLVNEDNVTDVGQVRIDIENDCAEIDYSIANEYRGQNLGKACLMLIVLEVKANFPQINKLVGKVKEKNVASMKAFMDSGFKEVYSEFEIEPKLVDIHEMDEMVNPWAVGGGNFSY